MDREFIRKQALEKELAKRFPEAAALYGQIGQYEKAAFLYQKSGSLQDAFEMFMRAEKPEKAAEVCLKAGYPEKAAELFARGGDFYRAGKLLVQAKRFDQAADCYQKAEKWEEAARMYLMLQNLPKAGEMYEKAGDTARAAEVYEQMIANKQDLDKLQGGDAERIIKILEKVQKFERAAEVYLHTQELADAIMLYIKMGDYTGAAKVYSTSRGDFGYDLVTRAKKEPELLPGLCSMFEAAKDYHMAGRVGEMVEDFARAGTNYALSGDPHVAGECFFKAGEKGKAAEMYEKAGLPEHAAPLFEEVGELEKAAENLERAGKLFQAGKRFYDLERYDKSIEVLQRLPDSDPDFLEATMIVGEILKAKGYLDLAVEKYRQVLANAPVDASTIEFRYRLARILMERNENQEAEDLLRQVMSVDFNYKDSQELVAKLESAAPAPAPSAAPAGPPPGVEMMPEPVAPVEPEVAPVVPPAAVLSAQEAVVQRMDGFQFLQETPLFQDLTLSEMKKFFELCDVVAYQPEEPIINEGQPGEAFYIIRSGLAKVAVQGEEQEEVLALLHEGEHFGEMGLIDDQATSASVVAIEPLELFKIPRDRFQGMLETQEKTAVKMYRVLLSTLSQRLRKVNEELSIARAS